MERRRPRDINHLLTVSGCDYMIHDGLAQFVSAPGKFLKEKID